MEERNSWDGGLVDNKHVGAGEWERDEYTIVTELQNGICINKAETSAGPFPANSRTEMRKEVYVFVQFHLSPPFWPSFL